MRQDDPRKCTAAKLVKLRFAVPLFRVRQIPRKSLVLNPFASRSLLPEDRALVLGSGLVAIDCSWEKVQRAFAIDLPGFSRKLPTLLACNPTNYARQHKLSSVEAIAAALYIMGFREDAARMLEPFKWGQGFLTLNHEPLESYSTAKTAADMSEAESQYF